MRSRSPSRERADPYADIFWIVPDTNALHDQHRRLSSGSAPTVWVGSAQPLPTFALLKKQRVWQTPIIPTPQRHLHILSALSMPSPW